MFDSMIALQIAEITARFNKLQGKKTFWIWKKIQMESPKRKLNNKRPLDWWWKPKFKEEKKRKNPVEPSLKGDLRAEVGFFRHSYHRNGGIRQVTLAHSLSTTTKQLQHILI